MKSERKFHIRCDMEGVSGVVNLSQVDPASAEYSESRRWFMAELLALIEGLFEGGATDVSIYDEHWFGRNIDLAMLPPAVRACCGKPPYRADWAGGLDKSHAGMILHGLHSMAGTGHVLCHTYEPDFRAITLNGKPVGEIGVESAIAGDWGVPLVLVIADSAGVAEAQQLVPGVSAVATKISHSATGAECFALAHTTAKIRRAGKDVASRRPDLAPFHIAGPVEMHCSFNPGPYLAALRRRAGAQFVGEDTLRVTGPTTTAAWADYWQLKLKAQADLARAR